MLSYQHAYHAGNAADVHKHALLATVLEYMTRKPKPLSYIETHAGRALYNLDGVEAQKTGEAAAGIVRMAEWFAPNTPYGRALAEARARGGSNTYPGSPMVAETFLRDDDEIHLAEMHPQEAAALRETMPWADIHQTDGPALALALTPPTPRRGAMLVDPSYELKTEFTAIPQLLAKVHRKWGVGVLMLWYPILASGAEQELVARLDDIAAESHLSEVRFPPARPGHGMIGSGLWVANPPWGFAEAAADLEARFETL